VTGINHYMRLLTGPPQFLGSYRPRQMSRQYELVQAIRRNPDGSWVSIDLTALPGLTTAAKRNSAVRAAKCYFKQPVQSHVEQQRLYLRIVPDPSVCSITQPVDRRPRPVFVRPPSQDQTPDRHAIA
jgi:hypothetical protein